MWSGSQRQSKERLAEYLDETVRLEKSLHALAAFLQRSQKAGQARTTLLKMPTEAKADCTTALWPCFPFATVALDGELAAFPVQQETNRGTPNRPAG